MLKLLRRIEPKVLGPTLHNFDDAQDGSRVSTIGQWADAGLHPVESLQFELTHLLG